VIAPQDGGAPRVLLLIGTRPEAIKMAPVFWALRAAGPPIEVRVALTGQHTTLVDTLLETLGLIPSWSLGVQDEAQDLPGITARCLDAVSGVLREWRPHLVLVQGDTASVFAGGVAAFLQGIPLGHVEAGLRTGDLAQPFPEEGFRRMLAQVTELHFAPTPSARDNLLREGVSKHQIRVTGNTVVDTLLRVLADPTPPESPVVARFLRAGAPPFFLLTAHRRESFGEPMERIFQGVLRILEEDDEVEVLFPVHPNPAVVRAAERAFHAAPRVHRTPPLGYRDIVLALAHARGVLTDSGGLQEEAPTFGTPVLVLREATERLEGLSDKDGAQRGVVVGTDPDRILAAAMELPRQRGRGPSPPALNPFGDGRAGERIAAEVLGLLGLKAAPEGDRRGPA